MFLCFICDKSLDLSSPLMLQQLKDLHFVTTDHFQGDLGRHRAGLLVEEDDPPEVDPIFCVLPFCILRAWKKKRGEKNTKQK